MGAQLKHTTLANGQRVACVSSAEVQRVHDQVQEYFRHGITVQSGDIVFDVGANIGLFALEACRRAEGRTTVYAFEPIPIIYQALRENAERLYPGQTLAARIGDDPPHRRTGHQPTQRDRSAYGLYRQLLQRPHAPHCRQIRCGWLGGSHPALRGYGFD